MSNLSNKQLHLINTGFTLYDLIEIVDLYNVNEYHIYNIYLRNTHMRVEIRPGSDDTPNDGNIRIDGLCISLNEINELIEYCRTNFTAL